MVTQATLQRGAIFLVVSGDIVCSSAGLNFIVQLESSDINDYKTTSKSNLDFWQARNSITHTPFAMCNTLVSIFRQCMCVQHICQHITV